MIYLDIPLEDTRLIATYDSDTKAFTASYMDTPTGKQQNEKHTMEELAAIIHTALLGDEAPKHTYARAEIALRDIPNDLRIIP